jgi:hypothetical protein
MVDHIRQDVILAVLGLLAPDVTILDLMFVIVEPIVILYLMYAIAMFHLVVEEGQVLLDQLDQQVLLVLLVLVSRDQLDYLVINI